MALKFEALLCDDIRREANGKLILVGVYLANIAMAEPATISLDLHIGITASKPGDYNLEFTLASPTGKKTLSKGNLKIERADTRTFIEIKGIQVSFEKNGWLDMSVRVNSGKPRSLLRTKIEIGSESSKT